MDTGCPHSKTDGRTASSGRSLAEAHSFGPSGNCMTPRCQSSGGQQEGQSNPPKGIACPVVSSFLGSPTQTDPRTRTGIEASAPSGCVGGGLSDRSLDLAADSETDSARVSRHLSSELSEPVIGSPGLQFATTAAARSRTGRSAGAGLVGARLAPD